MAQGSSSDTVQPAPQPYPGSGRQRPLADRDASTARLANSQSADRDGPKEHVSLQKAVGLEVLRTIFANIVPAIIMVAVFTVVFFVINKRVDDSVISLAGTAGMIAGMIRLAVLVKFREQVLSPAFNIQNLRKVELIFGASYINFALWLGIFGGRLLMLPDIATHSLAITMLLGYCAGVASTIGLHPVIAIPSLTLAVGPATVIAGSHHDSVYTTIAILMVAFMVGGCHSIILRTRTATSDMRRRITFGQMARQDALTALPNRLALREHFNAIVAEPKGHWLAVHYADLNGFKSVNDLHGHATGDRLLAQVAARFKDAVQAMDHGAMVARIGGDEFAVVQGNLNRQELAADMAEALSRSLDDQFTLGNIHVAVSASVGSAVCTYEKCDLDDLLAKADSALYREKG